MPANPTTKTDRALKKVEAVQTMQDEATAKVNAVRDYHFREEVYHIPLKPSLTVLANIMDGTLEGAWAAFKALLGAEQYAAFLTAHGDESGEDVLKEFFDGMGGLMGGNS